VKDFVYGFTNKKSHDYSQWSSVTPKSRYILYGTTVISEGTVSSSNCSRFASDFSERDEQTCCFHRAVFAAVSPL
jgi:hypothetical protein